MADRRVHVVLVQVEHLANDLGLWCNDCMLSSGIRVWFASTHAGVTTVRSTLGCLDCDGDNITAA